MNVVETSQFSTSIVRCELCSRRANLIRAGLDGWDWFTGRLKQTVHYCPDHVRSADRRGALEKAHGTGLAP